MDRDERMEAIKQDVRFLNELIVGDGKTIGIGPQVELNRMACEQYSKDIRSLQNDKLKKAGFSLFWGGSGAALLLMLKELFAWLAHR